MPKINRKPSKRQVRSHQHRKTQTAHSEAAIVHVAAPTERPWELNKEQVVLLKNYLKIADASDVELAGCLEVARRFRLDPFKQGQIWFVKRWDRNAMATTGSKGAFVYTPQVGIYGMLHIAARDHKDYGSISDAEFGPMFMHEVETHKFKAPEWCRVKAFKKGIAEPTVATIYFEEFCPAVWDNARLFWAKMPRAQIEKCAKARVVRTAYPDLGGLYIPEEMERLDAEVARDYTPGGRLITVGGVTPSGQVMDRHGRPQHGEAPSMSSEEIERLKAKGAIYWCSLHNCPVSERHYKECEYTQKKVQEEKREPAASETKEAKPWKQPEPKPLPKENAVKVPPAEPERTIKYDVELDWTDPKSPILRGDLSDLLPTFQKYLHMKWEGDWWHITPGDAQTLFSMSGPMMFRITEIQPKQAPPQAPPAKKAPASERKEAPPSNPSIVSGVIDRVNTGMAGKNPVKHVTLLLPDKTKPTFSCFDKKWFEAIDAGLGKEAQFVTKQNGKYTNIVGAIKIGAKEWDESGVPVIQNIGREPSRTLF